MIVWCLTWLAKRLQTLKSINTPSSSNITDIADREIIGKTSTTILSNLNAGIDEHRSLPAIENENNNISSSTNHNDGEDRSKYEKNSLPNDENTDFDAGNNYDDNDDDNEDDDDDDERDDNTSANIQESKRNNSPTIIFSSRSFSGRGICDRIDEERFKI